MFARRLVVIGLVKTRPYFMIGPYTIIRRRTYVGTRMIGNSNREATYALISQRRGRLPTLLSTGLFTANL